jgi:cephalosporin-C deacetylase
MLPSRVGGDTPDPHGAGPHAPGFMTKGIENPKTCYYRRVSLTRYAHLGWCGAFQTSMPRALRYKESAKAAASPWPLEASQTISWLSCPTCRLPATSGAADICDEPPYTEITRYLAIHRGLGDTAFTTVSYFDGVSFAERASVPALSSVGLMDQVCPPSTVYAAYHAYGGAKGHRRLPVQ